MELKIINNSQYLIYQNSLHNTIIINISTISIKELNNKYSIYHNYKNSFTQKEFLNSNDIYLENDTIYLTTDGFKKYTNTHIPNKQKYEFYKMKYLLLKKLNIF